MSCHEERMHTWSNLHTIYQLLYGTEQRKQVSYACFCIGMSVRAIYLTPRSKAHADGRLATLPADLMRFIQHHTLSTLPVEISFIAHPGGTRAILRYFDLFADLVPSFSVESRVVMKTLFRCSSSQI